MRVNGKVVGGGSRGIGDVREGREEEEYTRTEARKDCEDGQELMKKENGSTQCNEWSAGRLKHVSTSRPMTKPNGLGFIAAWGTVQNITSAHPDHLQHD